MRDVIELVADLLLILVVFLFVLYLVLRLFIAVPVIAQTLQDAPDTPLVTTVVVAEDRTYDPTLRFFNLTTGRITITLAGSQQSAIVQYLAAHLKQRVPLTLGSCK